MAENVSKNKKKYIRIISLILVIIIFVGYYIHMENEFARSSKAEYFCKDYKYKFMKFTDGSLLPFGKVKLDDLMKKPIDKNGKVLFEQLSFETKFIEKYDISISKKENIEKMELAYSKRLKSDVGFVTTVTRVYGIKYNEIKPEVQCKVFNK